MRRSRARPLVATGLAFGALAIPGYAAAAHSALAFESTIIGLAAVALGFALGFALAWLALAVRAPRR